MYWPVGIPRIYEIAELHSHINSLETNDQQKKLLNEDLSTSEKENLVKTANADALSSIDSALLGNGDRHVDQHEATIAISNIKKGHIFSTLTRSSITIWQSKPVLVLSSISRSASSLNKYGTNVGHFLREDSAICIARTSLGYLIIYTLIADPSTRIYKTKFTQDVNTHTKRQYSIGAHKYSEEAIYQGPGEGNGAQDFNISFKMAIRIDAGIYNAFTLQNELAVVTRKPLALQCIQWTFENNKHHTKTELLDQIPWLHKNTSINKISCDRAMNLSTWIGSDGTAYAVQRSNQTESSNNDTLRNSYTGFVFHEADTEAHQAIDSAINAQFSLIAVACKSGEIWGYSVKDYSGGISFSHKYLITSSSLTKCNITRLSYSPDGNCLFVGFKSYWAMWSVYGKQLAVISASDFALEISNGDYWEAGVRDFFWIGGGSELLMLSYSGNYLHILDMARCTLGNCLSITNPNHSLLQTSSALLMRKEQDVLASSVLSVSSPSWHQICIPQDYLRTQWPIKLSAISIDGRYIAVAGRRGLAHFSVHSGRWKTFTSAEEENKFVVRGGLSWYDHFLLVAVETSVSYEIRIYSRENPLDETHVLFREELSSSIIALTICSDDSLLAYTHDNVLRHYLTVIEGKSMKIHLIGQIAFHGIIKAPLRVRAVNWVLPSDQFEHGDPSQDVSLATLLFLIDGKLVSLQPSSTVDGDLKYQMRVIANNVEYFALMNDNAWSPSLLEDSHNLSELYSRESQERQLSTSLWYFNGRSMHVCVGADHALHSIITDPSAESSPTIEIATDFYPTSVLRRAGILIGAELEVTQRRDLSIVLFRNVLRTHLFLPSILRQNIINYNLPAALKLSAYYSKLPYFSHVLEILLHSILDEEVDSTSSPEDALLPRMLSFLSSFPYYRDVIVRCTRKTDVRAWNTLFKYLPSPQQLFEESLEKGDLKIAGGYLIISHTLEDQKIGSQQSLRLLRRAKEAQDWELCKELSRFLMALDESGQTLRIILNEVGVQLI